jgi:hypothetical protein
VKEHKNEGHIRIGRWMYVADMELLVDVGQLPASVFEEELANENERACEEVEKQSADKDAEGPAVFVKGEMVGMESGISVRP